MQKEYYKIRSFHCLRYLQYKTSRFLLSSLVLQTMQYREATLMILFLSLFMIFLMRLFFQRLNKLQELLIQWRRCTWSIQGLYIFG